MIWACFLAIANGFYSRRVKHTPVCISKCSTAKCEAACTTAKASQTESFNRTMIPNQAASVQQNCCGIKVLQGPIQSPDHNSMEM